MRGFMKNENIAKGLEDRANSLRRLVNEQTNWEAKKYVAAAYAGLMASKETWEEVEATRASYANKKVETCQILEMKEQQVNETSEILVWLKKINTASAVWCRATEIWILKTTGKDYLIANEELLKRVTERFQRGVNAWGDFS